MVRPANGQYDRERVGRLFDGIADAETGTGQGATRYDGNIPHIAAQMALEKLGLSTDDVLLDVGTGTGDMAIAAAHNCRRVIGIDISLKSLEHARRKAEQKGIDDLVFAYGSFEEPCAELDLASYGITRILAVYSLHHLPDPLKKQGLLTMAGLLRRPGRTVIGDIMFFEEPHGQPEAFDEVGYDGGETDFPARAEHLIEWLEQTGAGVHLEQVHPLVGVVTADYPR